MRYRMAFVGFLALFLLCALCAPTVQAVGLSLAITTPAQTHAPFSVPLDANTLTYVRGWRPGPDDRPILGHSGAQAFASSNNFGFALSLVGNYTALGVEWQRTGRHRTAVQSDLQWQPQPDPIVCIGFAPPCIPPVRQRVDEQVNEHAIIQHTLTMYYQYDFLHRNKNLGLAGRIGLQRWTVRDTATVTYERTRLTFPLVGDGPVRREVLEHRNNETTTERVAGMQGTATLEGSLWPWGKKRGLALTAQVRYIFAGPCSLSIDDTTLLDDYTIPVRQRRIQVYAGLALKI